MSEESGLNDNLEDLTQFISDNLHLNEDELLALIQNKFTKEAVSKYGI